VADALNVSPRLELVAGWQRESFRNLLQRSGEESPPHVHVVRLQADELPVQQGVVASYVPGRQVAVAELDLSG
jgi:hypothetical protein